MKKSSNHWAVVLPAPEEYEFLRGEWSLLEFYWTQAQAEVRAKQLREAVAALPEAHFRRAKAVKCTVSWTPPKQNISVEQRPKGV